MTALRADMRRAERLRDAFVANGAMALDLPILQPADALLDLYGEDIRARAYVVSDAVRGEQMLRPDFTLPVAQHVLRQERPGRYAYAGVVFRRQDDDPDRSNEYHQAGYEVFDAADPAEADAEVFTTIARELGQAALRPVTGDIGVLMAAVDGLQTTERRRAALRRHIWHPARFRALLDRFSGRSPVPARRAALLAADDPMAGAGPMIGLRGRDEIEARVEALRADAATPPIKEGDVAAIADILAVSAPCTQALDSLRAIVDGFAPIAGAVETLARRIAALARHGVDVDALAFEGSYGRSSMEYYDGFVFGFFAETRPDWPPVATGGRYDALMARLSGGRAVPGVGGVIRPDLLIRAEEGGA